MKPDATIHPFSLRVDDERLTQLRDRLLAARMPERETISPSDDISVADWSQGVPLAYLTDLAEYWATRYDWRRFEAEFNAYGPSVSRIDDVDIVFLHIRSSRSDARPLVITHGWPGSVIEPMEVARALAEPDDSDTPAFHVIAPALPGFGPSGKPATTGWSVDRTADAWAMLMTRLGYDDFVAAGGDWGGRVTAALAVRHPVRVQAIHSYTPYVDIPADHGDLDAQEQADLAEARVFWERGSGYSLEQSTRPQTLAYALTDSPVGQLAWIVEKFYEWTDGDGNLESIVTRDRMLDMVSLYWLTESAGSSARFYWENFPPDNHAAVEVPTAVTIFPREVERLPRSWVARRFSDLRVWNRAERGGHFPMLEVPESYVDEVRNAFRATLS